MVEVDKLKLRFFFRPVKMPLKWEHSERINYPNSTTTLLKLYISEAKPCIFNGWTFKLSSLVKMRQAPRSLVSYLVSVRCSI